jgi:hypothetical protein
MNLRRMQKRKQNAIVFHGTSRRSRNCAQQLYCPAAARLDSTGKILRRFIV